MGPLNSVAKPLNAPEFDGPGSFGEQQDTVTLDYLFKKMRKALFINSVLEIMWMKTPA
jgi:hypothetical protein